MKNSSNMPVTDPSAHTSDQPNQDGQNPDEDIRHLGKYTLKIIRSLCIGAGSCVALAPNTLELDDENIAVFLKTIQSQTEDADESLLLAAQSCPTAAIIVTETETGKQVWPPVME